MTLKDLPHRIHGDKKCPDVIALDADEWFALRREVVAEAERNGRYIMEPAPVFAYVGIDSRGASPSANDSGTALGLCMTCSGFCREQITWWRTCYAFVSPTCLSAIERAESISGR